MDKQTASSLQRPEIRYLLILGCTVRGDQPTQLLQTRIDRAAQYLKLHPQTIAVASGGCFRAGQQTSEAAVIQKGLCAKGIAPERILIEDQARSTAENFTLCKHLLESREGWDETETIAFVTNLPVNAFQNQWIAIIIYRRVKKFYFYFATKMEQIARPSVYFVKVIIFVLRIR